MIKIKAVAYARFSSENQREESLDAQLRAIREYAEKNDIQIIHFYCDRAKSATTDKRPQFQKMIQDSASREFEMVIVHKLDRFARNLRDYSNYKYMLSLNDIKLASVTENILDNTATSLLIEGVTATMAEFYAKNLASEAMKGLKENALNCKHNGGTPPLGYDVNPITQMYEINEKEAEAVRLIYKLYLEGFGYSKILDCLNEGGYVTKRGLQMRKNTLHAILSNEKYAGVYIYNRVVSKSISGKRNNRRSKPEEEIIRIEGGMPAIISKEEFAKAQEKMQKNKKKAGHYKAKEVYMLRGLVKCGVCGSAMTGNTRYSGRNKIKYVHYRCANRGSQRTCNNKEIRREHLEDYVLQQLQKHILNEANFPIIVNKINKMRESIGSTEKDELQHLEKKFSNNSQKAKNLAFAIANGEISSTIVNLIKELEKENLAIEARMSELRLSTIHQQPTLSVEMLKALMSRFSEFVNNKDVSNLINHLHNYIETIEVYEDYVKVVFVLSFIVVSYG